jgi:hypothetical protein
MGKLIISIPIIGVVLHFIITAILALLLVMTYNSLTKEQLIATITFDKENNHSKVYKAHLNDFNGSKIGDFTIYGDQWRIDAGFIKIKYWANVFGINSKYTLNRFEGRYKNINEENSKKHQAYQLEKHTLIDSFSPFFDTAYGSSVYKDIKLKTKYRVLKTQTGLMVREESLEKKKKEKNLWEKTKSIFGY